MRKPIAKLNKKSEVRRLRRKLSTRKKVSGTAERPRVVIFKGNKNISVQVVDDAAGKTLFSVQTFGKNGVEAKANREGAKTIGAKVAEQMKSQKLEQGVFDRGGYPYHGIVASLADSIRENGVKL